MFERTKGRTKSGRSPELSKETSCQIKKELKEAANVGLQQVEELIIKKSGVKYPYTHIYSILRKWEFKQKVSRKVYVSIVLQEKKKFSKRQNKYL